MEKNIIDNDEIGGFQILPNSTAVLVLGILSIIFCFCYGIVGLILGIIALVLAGKSMKMYNQSPTTYNQGSYKNLKAGRICAIIGTCLSGLYFLIILIAIIFIGSAASLSPLMNLSH